MPSVNFSRLLESQTPEGEGEFRVTSTPYDNPTEILPLVSNRYMKHQLLQRFSLLLGHLYLSCEGEGH